MKASNAKWDKVFKNGPSEICGRQPLKNFKGYSLLKQTITLQIFKGCIPKIILGPFLNTLSQMMKVWQNSFYFSLQWKKINSAG